MNLYSFSRGKQLTCLPLKSNYVQDIVFEKDVSISCTEMRILSMSLEGLLIRTKNRNDANSVERVGTEQVDLFAFS